MSEFEKKISLVPLVHPSRVWDDFSNAVPKENAPRYVTEEDFKALARAAMKLRAQSEYLMSQVLPEEKLKRGMLLLDESAIEAWDKNK